MGSINTLPVYIDVIEIIITHNNEWYFYTFICPICSKKLTFAASNMFNHLKKCKLITKTRKVYVKCKMCNYITNDVFEYKSHVMNKLCKDDNLIYDTYYHRDKQNFDSIYDIPPKIN